MTKVGDEGASVINGEEGLHIPQLGVLKAQQHFKLAPTDTARFGLSVGKFRVTTLSYLYSLRLDRGDNEIRWHSHPTPRNREHLPHMHLSFSGHAHLPGSRHTFEDVVESCLEMIGPTTALSGW